MIAMRLHALKWFSQNLPTVWKMCRHKKYCFMQKNYTFTQLVFIIGLIPISQLETVWTQPTNTGPVRCVSFCCPRECMSMILTDWERIVDWTNRLNKRAVLVVKSVSFMSSQCRMRPYCNRDLQQWISVINGVILSSIHPSCRVVLSAGSLDKGIFMEYTGNGTPRYIGLVQLQSVTWTPIKDAIRTTLYWQSPDGAS